MYKVALTLSPKLRTLDSSERGFRAQGLGFRASPKQLLNKNPD